MRRQAADPALKAKALEIAERLGAAQASVETGVPASTIRAWRSRAREEAATIAPAEPGSAGVEQSRRTMQQCRDAAEDAVARLREVLASARGPQAIAVAMGIAIDKAEKLEATIATAQEREHRYLQQDASLMLELERELFRQLGFEFPLRFWNALLRAAVEHARPTPDGLGSIVEWPESLQATAAEARQLVLGEVRAQIRRELKLEREQRDETARGQRERLGLPAPAPELTSDERLEAWQQEQRSPRSDEPNPSEDGADDDSAGSGSPSAPDEPELVEGEVVDEEPRRDPHRPPGGWMRYMGGAQIRRGP